VSIDGNNGAVVATADDHDSSSRADDGARRMLFVSEIVDVPEWALDSPDERRRLAETKLLLESDMEEHLSLLCETDDNKKNAVEAYPDVYSDVSIYIIYTVQQSNRDIIYAHPQRSL